MRRPLTVFIIVLALIAAAIACLFGFGYKIHWQSAAKLLQATDTLAQENPGLRIMDDALLTLNAAEGNFRMFTVTYKKRYLQSFSTQLGQVLSAVDSISGTLTGSDHNAQFDELIAKKAAVSEKIALLKKSTDSMLSHSITDDRIDKLLSGIPAYKVTQIKKDEVTMDTVNNVEKAPEKKKGFFKRLGNALANKKDTVKAQMAVMVRTKSGKVIDKESYDAQRMKDIITDVNGYYKKVLRDQLTNRMKINTDEQGLAGTNLAMLDELKSVILALRENAAASLSRQKLGAKGMVQRDADRMKEVAVWGVVSLILLLLALAGAAYTVKKQQLELKAKEAAALEQARMRTDFLANMSHEIRTPLNAVVGFSEQLSYTELATGQRELLHSVEVAADMLMQVVNDVLDFSKLEKDYISILREPFVLYTAFEEVISTTRVLALQKNLAFHVNFDGNVNWELSGDAFRLKQILLNLISNAVKYTTSGSVTIAAKLEKKSETNAVFTCSVTDTGEGISEENQRNLFERFYQASTSRVSVKGTGLGLAITKRLVELHGGTISFTSEHGKGTQFICQIPYEIVSAPLTTIITQQEPEDPSGAFMEGLYVLVAEDQDMNLLLMKMMLTRWKCRFDMARDGELAYQLFEQHHYDLILLDLHMPKLSGLEVLQKIRKDQDPAKANVVVLALTADISEQDIRDFKRVGFNDWLMKPFREMDIYKVIRKNLRLGEAKQVKESERDN